MASSKARKLVYENAKKSKSREVQLDFNAVVDVRNGKLYWANTSQVMSDRWVKAILEGLQLNSIDQITAEMQTEPITFIAPPEKKGVSNAIGSWFEYCYWEALSNQAKADPDIKSVEQRASDAFMARGGKSTFITEALSTDDLEIIKKTAERAAVNTLRKAKNGMPKDATFIIEAVAGSDAAGDILVKALNKYGQEVNIPRLMPYVELKYYKGDNITFSTLSDKNYYQTFSQYLFGTGDKYWSLEKDTQVWLSTIQHSGLQDYLRYGLAPPSKREPAAIFTYLLQKGNYKQDLSKKSMIVVNSSNDNITFTASLKTLRDNMLKKGNITIREKSTIFEGDLYAENKKFQIASLTLADPNQLSRESVESSRKTQEVGPDWHTTFRFVLSKAFYG